MEHIGKYKGIMCYQCSMNEYEDMYHNGKIENNKIYIVNGIMVNKGIIIGYYDGRHVVDDYNAKKFEVKEKKQPAGVAIWKNEMKNDVATFTAQNSKWDEKFVEEVKAKQEGRMTVATYEELVKQDIHFGKYSTVVDQFFALLEAGN